MIAAVTGGSGFIGSRLIELLSRQGHTTTMLSRRPKPEVLYGVRVLSGDLTSDACPLDRFLDGCDVVFHCAGELRDRAAMEALHIGGTRRLLKAALIAGERRRRPIHWVQLSSVGAYGAPPGGVAKEWVVTEESPHRPVGVYEVTKTRCDEFVIQASGTGSLTYSIIRPSIVFGRNMPNTSLRSLGEVIRDKKFFYIGPPGAVATYVHVDDVAELLYLCGSDERAQGNVFNLSSDCALEDMVKAMAATYQVPSPRMRLPEPFVRCLVKYLSMFASIPLTQDRISALIRRTRYPNRKLEQRLGFTPRRTIPHDIGEVLTP